MNRHPLDGALLRVDRAGEHLADLSRRIRSFQTEEEKVTAIKVEGMTVSVVGEQNEPPPMLSVVVGEVVQNLRTALDYLIYELAAFDSGSVQERTQFPIEDTREGFARRRKSYLQGVSDERIGRIEDLQPYKGCDWTRLIRDISNQDKHRTLHVLTSTGASRVRVGATVDEAIAAGGIVREGEVGVYFKPTFDVVFPDETPIMKPLPVLESEVRAVLEAFMPEFKR